MIGDGSTERASGSERRTRKWPWRWACWLVLLWAGWMVRLYQLAEDSLWFDEIFTWRYASPPIPEIIRLLPSRAHPPLAMIPFHVALRVGEGEFILRFPSVFFGLIAIPTTYVLMRRLLGRREGWMAAVLAACSPFLVRMSQEARAYTLLLVLSSLSAAFLWRAVRTNSRWQWIGFSCSLALALYTHYFALFVLASEVLFGLLVVGREWLQNQRTGKVWPPSPRVVAFGLSLLAVFLAYLPWAPAMRQGLFERQLGKEAAAPDMRISPGVVADQFAAQLGINSSWALWLTLGLLVVGLVYLCWQRRWRQMLMTGLFLGVPWGVLAAITPRKLLPRYLIFLVPFQYGLVVAGATGLSRLVLRWIGRRRTWTQAGLAFLMVGTILVIPGLFGLRHYYGEQKMDLRGVAQFLADNLNPGRPISAPAYDNFLRIYQPALEAHLLPSMSLEAVEAHYHERPRLWFVRGWGQGQNIDRDGSMRDWVDALPAVVFEFYDIKVLYLGSGVSVQVLAAESREFTLPKGVTVTTRE